MLGFYYLNHILTSVANRLIDYLVNILLSIPKVTGKKKMGKGSNKDPNIWFDGVDKKLLEAHTRKPTTSREADEKTLVTKTPLATLSSYLKKMMKSKTTQESSSSNGLTINIVNNGITTERQPQDYLPEPSSKGSTNHSGNQSNRMQKLHNSKDTIRPNTGVTDELAMDCEMVECFHNQSTLARVSIVNLFGHPILDKYVAPPAKVTDYRTKWSGIRRKDLLNAPDFETVQKEVANLIEGRIVIGHAIHNDFSALKLSHPPEKTRDTSEYFRYLFQGKTPSLKKLCQTVLGVNIQKGEHDSVQDAQATMKLYVKERDKWNERILKGDLKSTITHPKKSIKTPKKQKTKPAKKKMKTFWVMS